MLELDEKRRDVFENLKSIPRTTDTVSAIAALYPHLGDESTKRAAESYLFCECVGSSSGTTGKKDEMNAESRVGACLRSGMTNLSDDAVRNLLSHHADFELFAALTGSYFVDGKGYVSIILSDVAKRKMVEYASKRIDGISRSSETTKFLRNAFVLLENICSSESTNFDTCDTETLAIFVSRIVDAMRNASERSLRAVDEMRNFLKRSAGNASILPFVEQLVQKSLKVGVFPADAALAAVKSPETILACLEETDRLVEAGRLSFEEARGVLLLGKKFLGEERFQHLFEKALEHVEKTMLQENNELVLDFAYECIANFDLSPDEVSKLVRLLEKTPAETPKWKWYARGTENFATGVDEILFTVSMGIERKNFEPPEIVYGNTAKIVSTSGRYVLDDEFLDVLMRDRTNHYSRLGTKEQKQNLEVANAKLLMISAFHGDDETSARAMCILKERSSKSSSFAACVKNVAERTLRKELYGDAKRFLVLGKNFFGPRRKMSPNSETGEELFRMMKRHVEEGSDDKAERAFACLDFLRSCVSGFSSKEKNFEETLEPAIKELFLFFADEASRALAGTENSFEEKCEPVEESTPVL